MALAVVVAATAWVASGQLGGTGKAIEPGKAPAAVEPRAVAVRVARSEAVPRPRHVVLRGRTEPNRTVTVRSETVGRVATIEAERGGRLAEGARIATLAEEDRPARLAEARALLAQREAEYRASRTLAERGFRADNQHAVAQAQLDAARAQVRRMEVESRRTVIRAPFEGVLERRPVELGHYLQEGDEVAVIVDLDPMVIVAYLTETDRARVEVGHTGTVRLATGEEVAARVRYLSAKADDATRTFRIELETPNPGHRLIAGVTAEIRVAVEEVPVHRITPALLALDEQGQVGVKTVGPEDRVEFRPVRILADGPEGMWVGGLPAAVRLITVGQEFVRPGQQVRPVADPGTAAP